MKLMSVDEFNKTADESNKLLYGTADDFVKRIEAQLNSDITEYTKLSNDDKDSVYINNDYCVAGLKTDYEVYNGYSTGYAETEFGTEIRQFSMDQQKRIRKQIAKDFADKGWHTEWKETSFINGYNVKCFVYVLKINC